MRANGTQLEHAPSRSNALDATFQVVWTGVVSRRQTTLAEAAHEQIQLVVQVEIINSVANIEAWIERADCRTILLASTTLPCMICEEHGFIHYDIASGDARLLAVTFTNGLQAQLVYAQSSLLNNDDFTAGMFDPPTLLHACINRNMIELPQTVAAAT